MRAFEQGSLSALAGAMLIWSVGLAITAVVGVRLGGDANAAGETSKTAGATIKPAMPGVAYAGNSAGSNGTASSN